MSDTFPLAWNEIAETLVGDPTLEICDDFARNAQRLWQAVSDEVAAGAIKVMLAGFRVTCGICEKQPVAWVAVERDDRMVRVARCDEHKPPDTFMDLISREEGWTDRR